MLISSRRALAIAVSIGALLFVQAAVAGEQELRLFQRYSTLSGGLSDWQDWKLYWGREDADKDKLYAELENQSRYDINDSNIVIGHQYHMDDDLEYRAEAGFSQNTELFPAYALLAGMMKKLNRQTILDIELKHSHFYKVDPITSSVAQPDSEEVAGRLEYYFGNSLIAYSLYYTLMQGTGLSDSASSHSIKYLYVYHDRSNAYLSLSGGNQIDYEPTTAALAISRINSIALGGTHWLSAKSALIYTIARHQVASSGFGYDRNEFYIGLRRHI